MAEDKTCSGFGVDAKEPTCLAQKDLPLVTAQALGIAVVQIAEQLRIAFERGAIRENPGPGIRGDYVLLEAARRLIERKEP